MAFLDKTGLERLWGHIIAKLGNKADKEHAHDDKYYTEVEIDKKLQFMNSATGHAITLPNNAAHLLSGLKIFGKTTQSGTPSLDVPADFVNIGSEGSITTIVTGKNLLPKVMTDGTNNGMTITTKEDGSVVLNGTAEYNAVWKWTFSPAIPAGTYTLSCNNDNVCTGNAIFMVNTVSGDPYTVYPTTIGSTRTFTSTEPINGVQFTLMQGSTANNVTVKPQLERGTTATEYEPYHGDSSVISLDNGIVGFPVSYGGNYTDSDGQQWIGDELDIGRGEYIQNVPFVTFDGSNRVPVVADGTNAFYLMLPVPSVDTTYLEAQTPYLMCDRLPVLTREQVATGTQGVALSNVNLLIKVDGVTTVDEMVSWLQANPITICYWPHEPMNNHISLSADVNTACKKIMSFRSVINVLNSENAWQELGYVDDMCVDYMTVVPKQIFNGFELFDNFYGLETTIHSQIGEGDTFIVEWDGVKYTCKSSYLDYAYYIGNPNIINFGEEYDTGEPFLIEAFGNDPLIIYTNAEGEAHTLSIIGDKIADKNIPESIARRSDNTTVRLSLLDNITGRVTCNVTYATARELLMKGVAPVFMDTPNRSLYHIWRTRFYDDYIEFSYQSNISSTTLTTYLLNSDNTITTPVT